MALRVLLADESTTIKKVMQLALQDFAIEVKAVHVGVDVLEVARTFQPDVVFADILLQKKNGYEVCHDLKNDPKLKSIPVVLMWSSFMEFDEALATKNGAEGRLEKPFDVEALRKLILELVPKTRTQRLAHFLEFSDQIAEPLRSEGATQKPVQAPAAKPAPAPEPVATPQAPPPVKREEPEASTWNMDSFEDVEIDSFKPLDLSGEKPKAPPSAAPPAAEDREPWAHQDLSRFKVDLPPVSVATEDIDLKIDLGEAEFSQPQPLSRPKMIPPEPATSITSPTAKIDPQGLKDDTLSVHHPFIRPDFSQPDIPVFEAPLDSLDLDLEVEEEPVTPIAPLPMSLENRPDSEGNLEIEETTLGLPPPGAIPQMDADRLEEIIRAQSRDIIEAVVRKIVPDLAESIIRSELERLLGDEGSGDVERPRSP